MTTVPTHHLDPVTLIDYASGAIDPALAAVVTLHIMLCPRCRRDLIRAETVAGALLSQQDVADARPLAAPAVSPQTALDTPPQAAPPALDSIATRLIPPDGWRALGLPDGHIRWRRLGPGVWHHLLRAAPGPVTQGDLRLMRIAAGTAVPEHGHGGTELTLVLSGAFSDVTGTYRRGDIQDVDADVEHQPIVTPDAECICLVASEAPARYKTWLGRVSQFWTGM